MSGLNSIFCHSKIVHLCTRALSVQSNDALLNFYVTSCLSVRLGLVDQVWFLVVGLSKHGRVDCLIENFVPFRFEFNVFKFEWLKKYMCNFFFFLLKSALLL